MRSTETIKRDIARAEARITKNTESIARLTARNEKYHKKLEEFRYTFKGDGKSAIFDKGKEQPCLPRTQGTERN